MKRHVLNVTKREIFGKKLKRLRREGVLPANIYGPGIQSLAVQVPMTEFKEVYKEAGSTGLIDLMIDGKKSKPVLIHNLAYDYEASEPLHADFFQVNLKEKVTTTVPVIVEGEAPAVAENLGQLIQPVSEIEVEALPTELPENITIDISKLATLNDQITLGEVTKPEGVEFTGDPNQVVVKIAEIVVEPEPEVVAGEEAGEAETETTEPEGKPTEESSEEK